MRRAEVHASRAATVGAQLRQSAAEAGTRHVQEVAAAWASSQQAVQELREAVEAAQADAESAGSTADQWKRR